MGKKLSKTQKHMAKGVNGQRYHHNQCKWHATVAAHSSGPSLDIEQFGKKLQTS